MSLLAIALLNRSIYSNENQHLNEKINELHYIPYHLSTVSLAGMAFHVHLPFGECAVINTKWIECYLLMRAKAHQLCCGWVVY